MSLQMTNIHTQVIERLKELRLPVVRAYYKQATQTAQQEGLSYEQYLLGLIERECEVRQQNRVLAIVKRISITVREDTGNIGSQTLPPENR